MTNNNLIKFKNWLYKDNLKNLKILTIPIAISPLLVIPYIFINRNEIRIWVENNEAEFFEFMFNLTLLIGVGTLMLAAFALFQYSKKLFEINELKNPKINSLEDFIDQGEGTKREWKATARYSLRTQQSDGELYYPIIKSICAFANTDGGIILVGYDENSKSFIGIDNDGFGSDIDKWENWIRQKLDFHTNQQAVWVKGIRFHYHHHNNVICAEIKIKKHNDPIECSGIGNNKTRLYTYVRAGAYTRTLDSAKEIIDHFKNR